MSRPFPGRWRRRIIEKPLQRRSQILLAMSRPFPGRWRRRIIEKPLFQTDVLIRTMSLGWCALPARRGTRPKIFWQLALLLIEAAIPADEKPHLVIAWPSSIVFPEGRQHASLEPYLESRIFDKVALEP
jgi:hypothetical protein